MLRTNLAMLILAPAVLVGYAACGGEDASQEDNGAAVAEMTAKPTLIGTFRDEHAAGGIAVLTLKTDWTFHLEEAIQCIRFPCVRPEQNGAYRLETVDATNVLVLVNKGRDATTVTYFQYLYRNDVLYLARFAREPVWQALPRAGAAWCAAPNDCELQNLPIGPCAGGWYCDSNMCNYSCGPVTCLGNDCPTE